MKNLTGVYVRCPCALIFFFSFMIVRFPFDWKNPCGYLIAFTLQFTMLIGLYFYVACTFSFGIGIYMFGIALINDIKTNFHSINKSANSTKNNQIRLFKLLSDAIRLDSIVKQLSQIKILQM